MKKCCSKEDLGDPSAGLPKQNEAITITRADAKLTNGAVAHDTIHAIANEAALSDWWIAVVPARGAHARQQTTLNPVPDAFHRIDLSEDKKQIN